MKSILISWIGITDLRASKEGDLIGLGPVAQAASSAPYDEIILLSDHGKEVTDNYKAWLLSQTRAKIKIVIASLSGPTNFEEIYAASHKAVSEAVEGHESDTNLTFHLSPGTPAMAAVWIILSKTRFPASLIESSKDHGVKIVSVPLDISAEYVPETLKRFGPSIERLSAGLSSESPEFSDIIFRSEAMQRVILMARRVASLTVPVFIQGESGTGKEMLARAIHKASLRSDKPFIAVNCGAIPPDLVESELFGHEKGAFTGAASPRKGAFEEAHQGTLFLDEIGELPRLAQVKLLRVLQEREISRVGSSKTVKIDVRIVAATNRIIMDEVSNGNFREDLFYRLAVAIIELPPLREREGDIGLLIEGVLEKINSECFPGRDNEYKKISPGAKNLLLGHTWPGNVRELVNTLTRAVVWASDETITDDDIRSAILRIPQREAGGESILGRSLESGLNLPEIIEEVAVHYLKRGIEKCHGNKSQAAEILGLPSYQTLTNWLKRYGLE